MRNALASAGFLFVIAVQPALADGDAGAGEKVFARCKACHTVEEGGPNRVGPNLHGIVGRQAGSKEGFKYSKAMAEAGENGLVWNADTLSEYLENPRDFIKGNRMAFPGLRKPEEVSDVIAYLEANS